MGICYLLDGEMPPARQNGKSLPCVRLQAENAKLRELVRRMFYAVHPADREKFLTNMAELGV